MDTTIEGMEVIEYDVNGPGNSLAWTGNYPSDY